MRGFFPRTEERETATRPAAPGASERDRSRPKPRERASNPRAPLGGAKASGDGAARRSMVRDDPVPFGPGGRPPERRLGPPVASLDALVGKRNTRPTILVSLLTLATAIACSRERAPEPAGTGPPPLVADAPLSGIRTPAPPPTGEEAFLRFCAGCHGDDGRGFGRYAPSSLEPRPTPLHASGGAIAARTDADVARSIAEGRHAGDRSLCPPWGETLAKATIDAIVAHIRRLP